MFTRDFLFDLRRKALQRSVWFKALDRLERGILSLAARVVERVESSVLGVVLVKIVRKLRDAMKSEFTRLMEEFGLRQARTLARYAVMWGYAAARAWAADSGFVRYLTLINVNKPTGFGV